MLVNRRSFINFVTLYITMFAAPAAQAAEGDLIIADRGKTSATVVVSPQAGQWEKRAADDLVQFIDLMTGARPALANTEAGVTTALNATKAPVLIVGSAALKAEPPLQQALSSVAKKDPILRHDAIVVRRVGNRVYLAGTNDDSHYYAVVELLHRWGCRWYLPTSFGQCIPEVSTLTVDKLDTAYAPPFEVRNYWIAWNGSYDDFQEFSRRNRMNPGVGVPSGHAIGQYVQELIPKGKSVFNVPIAEDATANHIARKIAADFAAGKDVSLGMEDGVYQSESAADKALRANVQDKYFLEQSLTDNFLVLYNKVASRLQKDHPSSKAHLGFLAYSNITLPPQRDIIAAKPLVAYLAAIDVDPIHGMDDPRSPPRNEYREMMYRWAKVMQGRVVIYDYDQGMLVWRDIPNPSIQSIRQDIKHYRKAGILGVSTESRGAMATVFLNLFVRGQLCWNPDADVDALLAEFAENFYGPAAKPMAAYWNAIQAAWANSIVTEHEHFVIPAIYTPALVADLRKDLQEGEKLLTDKKEVKNIGANPKLYAERMKFTRLSFEVIEAYTSMVRAAASECDYQSAVTQGERGLIARRRLAEMNPTFTTRVLGVAAESDQSDAAWWPGEVKQYRVLQQFIDGSKGVLIAKTPLEWNFRRDPHDTGLPSGWAYNPVDMAWWEKQPERGTVASHQNNPGHWERLRTDLYMQAQGVISADNHSYTGYAWYRTEVNLDAAAAKSDVHILFPGLFNEGWLYVNGALVAQRTQKPMWWNNDYKFEWDVNLSGKVAAGKNTLTLRLYNPHHFGGMFRRPFLYRTAVK